MKSKSRKITVGIIFGGRSVEHEVSLVSAKSIYQALDKKRYQPVLIGVTHQGKWVLENTKGFNTLSVIKSSNYVNIPAEPSDRSLIETSGNISKKIDVFFPVIHGPYGEDGTLQGLLELTGIPYVGSNVLGSAVGIDKIVQKDILKSHSIPVVNYLSISNYDWQSSPRKVIYKINKELKLPIFVKPCSLGSSVGISLVKNKNNLSKAINQAFQYDSKVIVEQGIRPLTELECAVLGNDAPIASGVGEIRPSDDFYSYNAKYVDGQSNVVIPADISSSVKRKIQNLSIQAFTALNLSGMARIDFLLSRDKLYLNEVNTIPGFTSISMYPKLWEHEKITYSKLIDILIKLAFRKHQIRNNTKNKFKPKKKWYS